MQGEVVHRVDNVCGSGVDIKTIHVIGTGIPFITDAAQSISISPHPIHDRAIVYFDNEEHKLAQWRVYNLSGCLIRHRTVRTSSFDLLKAELDAGVYLYELSIGKEQYRGKLLFL